MGRSGADDALHRQLQGLRPGEVFGRHLLSLQIVPSVGPATGTWKTPFVLLFVATVFAVLLALCLPEKAR